MPTLNSVRDILQTGETALCIFTGGQHFVIAADRTGSSGHWFKKPETPFDSVIIFRWSDEHGQRRVEVFKALPHGLEGPHEGGDYPGRYKFLLKDISFAGTTQMTWEMFTGANTTQPTYVTG